MKLLIIEFSVISRYFLPHATNILLSTLLSNTLLLPLKKVLILLQHEELWSCKFQFLYISKQEEIKGIVK
jgi:hypothetical protein